MRRFICLSIASACILGLSTEARADGFADVAHIRDDEPAFTLTPASGDSALALTPRASMQLRAALPAGEATRTPARGDFERSAGLSIRRVRVGLDVALLTTLTAHVSTDLIDDLTPAGAKTPVAQAYANFDARMFQLRAGFLRVPFTRHALVDETRQVFLEAPVAWRADRQNLGRGPVPSVLPDRRAGAVVYEDYGLFSFAAGAFSGGGAGSPEVGSSALFTGRVELTPWMALPAEGAFFKDDYEARSLRGGLSVGGLGRTGPNGSTRAASAAVTLAYRGLYVCAEGVIGVGVTPGVAPDVTQRALTLDLAYRFPWALQGVELGLRGDVWSTTREFGDGSSDQRSASAVANLYAWRHRVKASALLRATKSLTALGELRDRQEAVAELTVGF